MSETESIAGGTGSDPLRCDGGCGFGLDVVAHVTANGKGFCEACASGCEEPLVDSVGIYPYVPENPRVARFCIFSAAEQADPQAVVGVDNDPSSEQVVNKTPQRKKKRVVYDDLPDGEIYGFKSRKRADEGVRGNRNSLLNGHL